jgi:hypothetical protein
MLPRLLGRLAVGVAVDVAVGVALGGRRHALGLRHHVLPGPGQRQPHLLIVWAHLADLQKGRRRGREQRGREQQRRPWAAAASPTQRPARQRGPAQSRQYRQLGCRPKAQGRLSALHGCWGRARHTGARGARGRLGPHLDVVCKVALHPPVQQRLCRVRALHIALGVAVPPLVPPRACSGVVFGVTSGRWEGRPLLHPLCPQLPHFPSARISWMGDVSSRPV